MGPLLLHVFINDLFFLVDEIEICNYADDATMYVCGHELEHIVSNLETDAQKLSDWFLDNSMKLKKIHERALRIAYKDSCSTFDDLKEKKNKAKSVSIHKRNLQ